MGRHNRHPPGRRHDVLVIVNDANIEFRFSEQGIGNTQRLNRIRESQKLEFWKQQKGDLVQAGLPKG